MEQDSLRDHDTVSRRRTGLVFVAILAVLVVASMYWLNRRDAGDGARIGVTRAPAPAINTGGEVGTGGSGTEQPRGADANGGPPAVVPPAIIQEIETITGSIDGNELVGRRVDLHVKVQNVANDVAFWVGEGDNRVLVVIGRDNRNGAKRQQGVPAANSISPVQAGEQAAISGVVQRLPKAEEMYSWQLTRTDVAELSSRPIYIRADRVNPAGHAEGGQ